MYLCILINMANIRNELKIQNKQRLQQPPMLSTGYKIGSGLNNLGNTCFFNAVMQIMLYTPSLVQQFNLKIHSSQCTKNDWCIFCALEKLWAESKKNRVVSPHAIVSNLKFVFKKFRLGRQEDSHEFLRYLVEGMQQAETGKLGKQRQKNEKIIAKTLTYKNFGGKMRTFVLCLHCHHKSLTTERYYDLSIECQRSNTLLEGLQNYFKVDDLTGSNKYRCDNCKQLSNAKKGFKIITIPDVVTFQFKRFTNNLRKIGKLIEYPRTLNLNRYMQHEEDNEKTKLQLFGVVVHSGSSAGSGHYYAFVKNGQEWFEMNDSNVSKCNEDRVLRQQAYLLFYSKVKTSKNHVVHQPIIEQNQQIMTNIKQNHNKEVKMNGHVKQKEKQKEKEKQRNDTVQKSKQKERQVERPRKKSIEMRSRKLSQQQFEQTKRKLSMDIQQLKQQARQQSNTQSTRKQSKITLNGKMIESPIFGQTPSNLNHNHTPNHNPNHNPIPIDQQQPDQQQLSIPRKLQRRRSKDQYLSQLSIMQVLKGYAQKILQLQFKIPRRTTSSNRSLRSVEKLRKFQIISKKKKIGNG